MVVDVPEHIYLQERNGRYYVYEYTRYFRRGTKTGHESWAVGLLCDTDDMLMYPNDNYLRSRGLI